MKNKGIGCCPYELAIPELELEKNRWLDLIRMSKVYYFLASFHNTLK